MPSAATGGSKPSTPNSRYLLKTRKKVDASDAAPTIFIGKIYPYDNALASRTALHFSPMTAIPSIYGLMIRA